ncbi:SDR family oxidoreductase [Salinispora arenicola]|uniref:Short-chain dehydrogenase/reductase SDR n=1 Tax=Salinispora arenicola (strain CNS-205) TaxID=391037 RepID=A8M6E5_SALAI|nr:SDR family oxidoreductase [Salinispora arenicola]NIL41854.1 SDR family oxidoreductase [Salinispora arenicola]
MDPLDFTDRVVVVTGGTRGIGAAIASAFLAVGARVLVCGRNQPSTVVPDFVQADVREPTQAAALVAAAAERFGRIDVLVNNAGGAPSTVAATASPRLHAKIIELNLVAPLHVAQAANTVMQQQTGGGVIIMVGSVSGTRPSPGSAAYGAAKAGLHHLATSLAAEWAPAVRVNSVVPGPVAGDADLRLDPAAVARTVPLGRPATPAEVAGVCLLLASPMASYVTGAAVAVHGGGEWPGYLADLRGDVR